jgi:hypothetical protein
MAKWRNKGGEPWIDDDNGDDDGGGFQESLHNTNNTNNTSNNNNNNNKQRGSKNWDRTLHERNTRRKTDQHSRICGCFNLAKLMRFWAHFTGLLRAIILREEKQSSGSEHRVERHTYEQGSRFFRTRFVLMRARRKFGRFSIPFLGDLEEWI